jgi:hypothetical protein
MTAGEETKRKKVRINQRDLYREEFFTDIQTGTIRQLTPVRANGEIDKSRMMLFFGQTNLITEHGPLPIQFRIEAKSLQQAIDKFPDAMEQHVEMMVEEAKKVQREEQSRIIIPRATPADSNIILK